MKMKLCTSVAFAALLIPGAAFAQSTGTIASDSSGDIVVTGTRTPRSSTGVSNGTTPKASTILTNENLATASPGQTVLQAINVVPSVNFTNNDPSGASGGNVRIRGFDGNRISLTFDGLPLNDTGNYAIFSNQQLDPEIIDQVNVNQGTTDVDSPTAASSGGTINYRSLVPSQEFGALVRGSLGESYRNRFITRAFGMIQTGDILKTGIRGYVSASVLRAEKYRGVGDLNRQQFNGRLYKTFGSNGDFIAIAGHYNRNRNASYRSISLFQAQVDKNGLPAGVTTTATSAPLLLAGNGRYDFDNNPTCTRATFTNSPVGQSDNATPQSSTTVPNNFFVTRQDQLTTQTVGGLDTSCTNYAGVRLNPSNTGNARLNSKFSITPNLVFTLDGGYQYTLANGGGFTTLAENSLQVRAGTGTAATAGRDFSGDGDTVDTVAFYAPNNTNTNRYTVLSSLRWDFATGQSLRVAYAFDYGRHRQTGEWTFLNAVGDPLGVFGGRGGAPQPTDINGYGLRQRDRFSIAELNQVSGEYRGKFFDNQLEVMLGVRAPFFHRELNQYCYTLASSGNPYCTSQVLGTTAIPVAANGNYVVPNGTVFAGTVPTNAVYAPFKSTYNYRKVLPNVGFTFRPVDGVQAYAAYAKGLSAPRTDNLYRAPQVNVTPETTNNFDIGLRYSSPMVQASFGGFLNNFRNRIVTSLDLDNSSPTFGLSVDRNVGRVQIKGLEGTLDVRPIEWFSVRGFGSYIEAKYKDNLVISPTITLPLAGKRLVETPTWQYGLRSQVRYQPLSLGLTFKHVSSRTATDLNDVIVDAYNVVDFDARLSLGGLGMPKTYLQLNVNNLLDEQYLGSISSQSSLPNNNAGLVTGTGITTATGIGGSNPTFQPGSPRSWSLALQVAF